MNFTVSVVIPAFNVARFIEKSIQSALIQEPVIEVIVIDDGSTDSTGQIVMNLQKQDARIILLQHQNGRNKGRSASRNLGIQTASGNYVAFLDADDFYLANRFNFDQQVFHEQPDAEGVYNAVGFHYYRDVSEIEKAQNKVSTLSRLVPPENLFDAVISSRYGYLHLNGLTVKKTVFDKTGYFNENLVVAEDSDIIYKMALKSLLVGSCIEKLVAKRGIHENNIFNQKEIYIQYNPILYEEIVKWCLNNDITFQTIDLIFKYYWIVRYRANNSLIQETLYWIKYLRRQPQILFSSLSIKYFPIIRQRQILFPFLYR